MISRTQSLVVAVAAVATGAAASPGLSPAARQLLAAETAHAHQLTDLWNASHHGQADEAASQPQIVSGAIVVTSVDAQRAPSSPSIRFKFKAGPAGFNNAFFQFFNGITQQSITVSYSASTALNSGSYTILTPGSVGQYAGPGTYTLDSAGIGDNAGGFTFYSAKQLASIFPNLNINVTNSGTPDTTMPVLASGKIETPSVSLSSSKPLFLANLTVSDTISGVQGAFITFSDPNGNPYTAYNQAPSPIIKSTVLPVGFNLITNAGPNAATGTWTINSVILKDVAGNMLDTGNIQALFGTNTFQVVP